MSKLNFKKIISFKHFEKLNFQWHFKSGQNWRQLLKMDRIDFCSISRAAGFAPAGKQLLENMKWTLPTLPLDCPFLPKKYEGIGTHTSDPNTWNMTTDEYRSYKMNSQKVNPDEFVTPTLMPNGVYRVTLQLYTSSDPVGFTVQFQYEIYYRLNDETL